ncbi:hypothetical protein ACFO0N_12075 [Halobium salinum]|uniref:Uncharacterized protein n=1 Tax=Halobium salinum TaxID=1364940 RepID=A0ABD5PD84_9EURY|nr:hypothetical protein [Halobium salinum]
MSGTDLFAALLGVVAALAAGAVVPPVVAVAVGAAATTVVLLWVDGPKRYATAGTVFALGLAAALPFATFVADPFRHSVLFALLFFGGLGLGVVALKRLGRALAVRAGRRVSRGRYVAELWDALSSVGGAVLLAWSVFTSKKELAKNAANGVVGGTAFTLNVVGLELVVPASVVLAPVGPEFPLRGLLVDGLSTTAFVFVGSVVVWFHLLASWHATHRAARSTGAASRAAAEGAAERVGDAAGSARDRLGDGK